MNPKPDSNRLQAMARTDPSGGSQRWRPLYEAALGAAYDNGDPVEITRLINFAVGLLDGTGKCDQGLREVDQALAVVGPAHDVRGVLLTQRAVLLSALGRSDEARASIDAAQAYIRGDASPWTRDRSRWNAAVAECLLLQPVDLDGLATTASAARQDSPSEFLFVASWMIPYFAAVGEMSRAHQWIRMFRIDAGREAHSWRRPDSVAFHYAELAVRGDLPPNESEGFGLNWLAEHRARLLTLHHHLLRRDPSGATAALGGLRETLARAGTYDLGGIAPFEQFESTVRDPNATTDLRPPSSVRLWNLASVLAGGEAVAAVGTQAQAVAWLELFSMRMPGFVQTALDWPVARWRVQGLLAARAGNPRTARRCLTQAIEWSKSAGYPVEQARSEIALAEVLEKSGLPARSAVWMQARSSGWKRAQSLGLDPAYFAYSAARSIQRPASTGELTPRETEVLSLLARGLPYKAIAVELGIAPATVQTLAHRVYDKLEAGGRHAAVELAKELGII